MKATNNGKAILLLIFNRLDLTKKTFQAIKATKPTKLYIASDGPRNHIKGERELVLKVRDYVISNIDWESQVKTRFNTDNIGCGPNVKSSIDWFFTHEEEGIIIEDDCVAEESFFDYCEELLDRFKDDHRIGMISGTNHITKNYPMAHSYAFSKHKACWGGWATWKRSWNNMDFDMDWLMTNNSKNIIRNMGYGKASFYFWKRAIKLIAQKKVSAWDWQWYFSLAAQGQLCIFPKNNLISNIGFTEDATHTRSKPKKIYTQTRKIDFPLVHQNYICQNIFFDKVFTSKKILPILVKSFIPNPVKEILKIILRK